MTQCYRCSGKGWVPDGQIEDGMMTGREACPICHGAGELSPEQVLREIQRVMAAA